MYLLSSRHCCKHFTCVSSSGKTLWNRCYYLTDEDESEAAQGHVVSGRAWVKPGSCPSKTASHLLCVYKGLWMIDSGVWFSCFRFCFVFFFLHNEEPLQSLQWMSEWPGSSSQDGLGRGAGDPGDQLGGFYIQGKWVVSSVRWICTYIYIYAWLTQSVESTDFSNKMAPKCKPRTSEGKLVCWT